MDKFMTLFEYIGKYGILSSSNTTFTIQDFMEVEDNQIND